MLITKINFVELLILTLATWRLTSLLYAELGPGYIFTRIRCQCGVIHDSEGYPMGYPDTFIASLLACFWCLSVWFALCLGIGYLLLPHLTIMLCLPFALSGGAIIINEKI